MMRQPTTACLVVALLSQIAGLALAQEPGAGGPPEAGTPAAQGSYDEPPKLLRNWMTSYTIPKHGPKRPPDDNVVLEILVDTSGRVAQARVLKSIPFYDDIAIRAAKSRLYSPALKNGQPVAVRLLTSIHFGRVVDRETVEMWDSAVAPSPAPQQAEASVSVPTPVAAEAAKPSAQMETSQAAPPAPAPIALSTAAGAPRIELLSLETSGVDFADWLRQFGVEVARNWHGPKGATPDPPREAHFEIVLERDGSVSSARIVKRSGSAAFDRAGLKAFFDGSYTALPKTYPSPRATMLVRLSGGDNAATPSTSP